MRRNRPARIPGQNEHRHAAANDPGIVTALHGLGLVAQLQNDNDRAAGWYNDCIALEREAGHPKLSITLGNLAQIEHHRGNTLRAIELLTECIGIDRATGAYTLLTGVICNTPRVYRAIHFKRPAR